MQKLFLPLPEAGSTARLISRLRPKMPIIAMTPNEKCYHQMAFNWGVIPYLNGDSKTLIDAFTRSALLL